MVSDSIYNKYSAISIIALGLLAMLLIITSCKDSLGIEADPKITYIEKPPVKETKFDVDSVVYFINEKFNSTEIFYWDTNYTVIANNIKIDTNGVLPRLWINFKLKSDKQFPGFPPRADWVTEFEIRADSVESYGTFLLTEPIYKNRWYRISVIDYNNQKSYSFAEQQASALLKFYEYDKTAKTIIGAIEIEFFSGIPLETNSLIAFFRLYY